MRDFGDWLEGIGRQAAPVEDMFAEEPELPEGINEVGPGKYEARCCMCHEWRELYCDLSEVPEVGYEHYCGGSPRCCP